MGAALQRVGPHLTTWGKGPPETATSSAGAMGDTTGTQYDGSTADGCSISCIAAVFVRDPHTQVLDSPESPRPFTVLIAR